MIAMTTGKPYCAARTTDAGVPPTPTQVRSAPDSVGGMTGPVRTGGRTVPDHSKDLSCNTFASRSSFSLNSTS